VGTLRRLSATSPHSLPVNILVDTVTVHIPHHHTSTPRQFSVARPHTLGHLALAKVAC
jgi:hypothetical protein